MRSSAVVILIGIIVAAHTSSLAAQRSTDSVRALPVERAEFERLGHEVRTALLSSPEKFTHERYAKFAELQAAGGDLAGARESAQQSGTWYPFARVAFVQYKGGDLDGAIATTRMARTSTDRSQALGWLSSGMPFDEGLALARTIEWPKQLVEELRRAARDLFRTDTARSMALLREAIAVAQRDTASWGKYFDIELAYDQAERGDLGGALRIIDDTLSPGNRAERLGRIARELQRAPVLRARLIADSLFRVALRSADDEPDSAKRSERRVRVFSLYSAYATGTSGDVLLAESRTPAESAFVSPRTTGFASSLATDREDSTLFRKVRALEASGQFRAAVNELYGLIWPRSFGRMHVRVGPERAIVDSLARRSVENSRRVNEKFADSTRLRLVRVVHRGGLALAREIAESISDPTMRSSGMLMVARQLLESNPTQALEYTLEIPSRIARDSLYAVAAPRFFSAPPDTAIALTRRITTPSIRGMTLLDIAGRAASMGDTSLARTLALEGMPEIDALVHPLEGTRLAALLHGGLYDALLPWARSQPAPESRARVLFALYEAIAMLYVARSTQDEIASIRQLWTDYVDSKRGRFASNAGTPTTLWLATEQALWPMYDLAGFYIPEGAVLQSVSVQPAHAGGAPAYAILSQFAAAGSKPTDVRSAVVLTTTVYGVRHEGKWILANALPRKTATWQREVSGQITYHVEPGLTFNRRKAEQAAAFVDSLATVFAVPRVNRLDYYVTSSVDMALSIIGVEFPARYGSAGGFSKPVNQQLFSGTPSLGENYRHELAHVVLRPLLDGATMTILASEGVATWLGGTEGDDFRSGVRNLAGYLAVHPTATLDSIMDGATVPQWVRYTSGAVVCAMLFEAGGTEAIKGFLRAGPGSPQLRAFLVRALRKPWAAIGSDWRAAVNRLN